MRWDFGEATYIYTQSHWIHVHAQANEICPTRFKNDKSKLKSRLVVHAITKRTLVE